MILVRKLLALSALCCTPLDSLGRWNLPKDMAVRTAIVLDGAQVGAACGGQEGAGLRFGSFDVDQTVSPPVLRLVYTDALASREGSEVLAVTHPNILICSHPTRLLLAGGARNAAATAWLWGGLIGTLPCSPPPKKTHSPIPHLRDWHCLSKSP